MLKGEWFLRESNLNLQNKTKVFGLIIWKFFIKVQAQIMKLVWCLTELAEIKIRQLFLQLTKHNLSGKKQLASLLG